MNTRVTNYLIVASAALLVGAAIPRLSSVEIPATTPAQPLVSSPPAEQYLLIDASQVPVGNPKRAAPTLEAVLNDYGAQGWRVRATLPPFVIFAR